MVAEQDQCCLEPNQLNIEFHGSIMISFPNYLNGFLRGQALSEPSNATGRKLFPHLYLKTIKVAHPHGNGHQDHHSWKFASCVISAAHIFDPTPNSNKKPPDPWARIPDLSSVMKHQPVLAGRRLYITCSLVHGQI